MNATPTPSKPSLLAPMVVIFVIGFVAGYLAASFMPAMNSPKGAPHQGTDGRITSSTQPPAVPGTVEDTQPHPRDERPSDQEMPATPEHPDEEPAKAPTH